MEGSDQDVALRNSVIIPFLVISILFFVARGYVGILMTKTTGFDDLYAALGWGALVAQSFVELHQIQTQAQQGPDAGISEFPTSNLLYIVATGFLRLSIVAFLPRLNKQHIFRSLVWTVGFVIAIQTLSCFLVYLMSCRNIKDLWDPTNQQRQCLDAQREAYIFWAHSTSGVLVDLSILMMATWAVFFHQRGSAWNFGGVVVLLVGLFVLTAGVLQLGALISTDFTKNTRLEIDINTIWTQLQEHMGLWLACLPVLQPLSDLVSAKFGLQSKLKRLDSNPPGPDITVGRSSKRIAPLRIVPGPRIGIAVSTDLESGSYGNETKSAMAVEERQLARAKSIHVHARQNSEGIVKTTDVDVSVESQGGNWRPSKAW